MHVYWLGWQDSNLRMPRSKPGALPLGDTPTAASTFYNTIIVNATFVFKIVYEFEVER